jgi:hypothetical protein
MITYSSSSPQLVLHRTSKVVRGELHIAIFTSCLGQYCSFKSFMNIGAALRNCIPLGLTTCYPFKTPTCGGLSGPVIQGTGILLPTDDVIEQETRRNIFWLIYAMERQNSMGSGFAIELDDLDINQLLPVRGDQFELGVRTVMLSKACHLCRYRSKSRWKNDSFRTIGMC